MKGPTWFKVHTANRHFFEALPDDALGRGLKLALEYLATGELPADELPPLAAVAFETLRGSADEARLEYTKAVEAGRDGARKRWNSPPKGP